MDKKELLAKAHALQPQLHIGKALLSEALVAELDLMLKKKGLVKVKVLKSALETTSAKTASQELSERLGAKVISCVGHTFVLWRKQQPL